MQIVWDFGIILLVVVVFGKIRRFIFNRSFRQLKKLSLSIAKETLPAQVKAFDLSEKEIKKDIL